MSLIYDTPQKRHYPYPLPKVTSGREIVQGLKRGRWSGNSGSACCPSNADRTPSLTVTERGDRVLVRCHAGCAQSDVIDALRGLGLWHDAPQPATGKRRRRALVPDVPAEPASEPPLSELDAQTRDAVRIWRNASTCLIGTPAGRYLDRRGLGANIPPNALRFTREQHPFFPGRDLPALVVARHSPRSGLVRGVQMVFLEDDGRKCRAVDKPKITFGGSGMNLRAELYWAGMSEDLVICEGAESALAAAILFERPAVEYWA